MTGARPSIEIVTDPGRLAALEGAWWALWRTIPDATPFTSPAWLLPWWNAFGPGEMRSVALWSGDRLAALAPCYVEAGEECRRLLPLGIGLSDRLDILVDPGLPDAIVVLARGLHEAARDVEIVSLEELGDGAAAFALPCLEGWTEDVADQNPRPVLPLRPGDRLDSLPSRKRRKVRMAGHRTERRGGRVETVGADGLGPFLDDLVRLHDARWSARGEPGGIFADPRVRAFLADALPRLQVTGLVRLLRLVIEDRVAGAYLGLQHGPTACAYLGGFDPDFAFESPGTVLVAEAIAAAARDGCSAFDFLRGQEAYKYDWGANDSPNRRRTWQRR